MDLVGGRDDAAVGEEVVNLALIKVRNSDSLGFFAH